MRAATVAAELLNAWRFHPAFDAAFASGKPHLLHLKLDPRVGNPEKSL
jgi:thiamine pyrophosphate-dependent acetolactate synthase large subunit-like protein